MKVSMGIDGFSLIALIRYGREHELKDLLLTTYEDNFK